MGRTIKTAAVLDGVSPLKDGGLSMRFHTQEMSKSEMAHVMEYYQSTGHLLFNENSINISEVPATNAHLDGGKSPSKRLRDRMYVVYASQHGKDTSGFEKWYERQLEIIGQQYLDKVERGEQ